MWSELHSKLTLANCKVQGWKFSKHWKAMVMTLAKAGGSLKPSFLNSGSWHQKGLYNWGEGSWEPWQRVQKICEPVRGTWAVCGSAPPSFVAQHHCSLPLNTQHACCTVCASTSGHALKYCRDACLSTGSRLLYPKHFYSTYTVFCSYRKTVLSAIAPEYVWN